jgi:hypothetical protein
VTAINGIMARMNRSTPLCVMLYASSISDATTRARVPAKA